jgi:ATP-dependent helicase Lhr and Lhr-like helicase
LLARIHRLTLSGLRRQIQPVEPREFLNFLCHHQHLAPASHWGGPVGVREAVAQLQGFELPAGAWEDRVLAARVGEYDPVWLDQLFLAGEVVWGRLNPPRRDDEAPPSMAMLTRVVPISLLVREELAGLLAPERGPAGVPLRWGAARVVEVLTARGALFFNELKAATELLPAQLEESLRELAAAGLVSSDAFAAIRKIVGADRSSRPRRRRGARPMHAPGVPIGRWSLFPGPTAAPSRAGWIDAWCRQLLVRYGVVFRDVLVRETSAPAWNELAAALRRMELRGEVRGGRFVAQVSGEQYAGVAVVERLREQRQSDSGDGDWIVLSAADPVNLWGVVTSDARIPATHRNALVVRAGRVVATRQAGRVEFREPIDDATAWEMRRAMTLGRRAVQAERSEDDRAARRR